MLETLFFLPRPSGHCARVLGVLASRAPERAVDFSVPAHALATLNVVLEGTLAHAKQVLPDSFATGCHTRSRRYVISPRAVLLTLFCRADVLTDLSNAAAASFTDVWTPAEALFQAWRHGERGDCNLATDALAMAEAMLDCVAPAHLPPMDGLPNIISAQRLNRWRCH